MKYAWLIVRYEYEQSDVIAICSSRSKAYEFRNEYIENYNIYEPYDKMTPSRKKTINVIKRDINKLPISIYE